MSQIKVSVIEGMDLWYQYPTETKPQPVYVLLDCGSGQLSADWCGLTGDAVPSTVYHGQVQRWSIPPLKGEVANKLLQQIQDYAQRVVDGYSSRWNGSKFVVEFDNEATEAIEEIEKVCQEYQEDSSGSIIVWDACDWYEPAMPGYNRPLERAAVLGITPETTDEQLEEIATKESDEASGECDYIRNHLPYLTELRDRARMASQGNI